MECVLAAVILFAIVAFAIPAKAQNNREYVPNSEIAATIGEASTCFDWSVDEEGVLHKDVHGGFGVTVKGGYDILSYSSPTADDKTSSFGYEVGLNYKAVKKNWPVAGILEVTGGWYSGQKIEFLETKGSLNVSAEAFIELFPHAPVHLDLGGGVRYVNTVSQASKGTTTIKETSTEIVKTTTEENRKWKGNAFSFVTEARLGGKLFSIKHSKPVTLTTNKGNKIDSKLTTSHEVEWFASASWTPTYKVAQEWSTTINSERNNLRFGAGLIIRFK